MGDDTIALVVSSSYRNARHQVGAGRPHWQSKRTILTVSNRPVLGSRSGHQVQPLEAAMKYPLTLADIHSVKRHAKRLKVKFPELPHTKRLDMASVEVVGARSYHELNCNFEKVINQNLDVPDGPRSVSHCLYCDYRFAADYKPDQKTHREIHERFMEVSELLNYRPGTYVERERMKQDGYHQANHAEQIEDRVDGLLMIARAWFDRSFHDAVSDGYWKRHPSFEKYVAMIVPHLEAMYPAIAVIVVERYGRMPGLIPKGSTYWPMS